MRNPQRIEEIQALIGAIWLKYPDLRFMQLIYILQGGFSEQHNDTGLIKATGEDGFERIGYDLFNIEDDILIRYLNKLVESGIK